MKNLSSRRHALSALLGVELNATTHREKLIAGFGSLLGIIAVAVVCLVDSNGSGVGLLMGSMGATAVLLFVVPHGALSQPWPVVGGHLVSAFVGVVCQKLFPPVLWASAFAVAFSILAMQYLRCVHPPGGATALLAVTGGSSVHALGFRFLLDPVLLNVGALMLVAIVFNNLFAWRRYPAALTRRRTPVAATAMAPALTQEDFEAAMHQLDTFVDVSSEELVELVELARRHAEADKPHPASIETGHSYSNGRLGKHWSVRQVVDMGRDGKSRNLQVIYKTMAGEGAWDTGLCDYEEFRLWARFEVESINGRWVRTADQLALSPA